MPLRPRLAAAPLRRLALAAVMPLALYAASRSEAHEWTSPAASAAQTARHEPDAFQPLWAGPPAGRAGRAERARLPARAAAAGAA